MVVNTDNVAVPVDLFQHCQQLVVLKCFVVVFFNFLSLFLPLSQGLICTILSVCIYPKIVLSSKPVTVCSGLTFQ